MAFSPLRQLAIRLACAQADDRAWVLAQLGQAERLQLDVLLQEIADLGLAQDPAVLAAIQSEPSARFSSESAMPDDVALHAQVVRTGHPFWGALLLQCHPERQRRKVMNAMAEGTLIRRWDRTLSAHVMPPALLAALASQATGVQEVSDVGT